jgi:hypothetical protein
VCETNITHFYNLNNSSALNQHTLFALYAQLDITGRARVSAHVTSRNTHEFQDSYVHKLCAEAVKKIPPPSTAVQNIPTLHKAKSKV